MKKIFLISIGGILASFLLSCASELPHMTSSDVGTTKRTPAGKVFSLTAGQTMALPDGSVVACMGTAAAPQQPCVSHTYTCYGGPGGGDGPGKESYSLCEAVKSAIQRCYRVDQHSGSPEVNCAKDRGLFCKDETGSVVDASSCPNSI